MIIAFIDNDTNNVENYETATCYMCECFVTVCEWNCNTNVSNCEDQIKPHSYSSKSVKVSFDLTCLSSVQYSRLTINLCLSPRWALTELNNK